MEYRKLREMATISISNVDKKTAENEKEVKLCNFVDVYRNWAITKNMTPNFMVASAKESEIEKYALHKGDVCITKDSETKDDIGMSTYIADDIEDLVLGYHCALISPDKSVLDGKYLNTFLQTDFVRKFYELNASGSGQRYTLSLDAIGDIPIPVISLEEQQKKGELLSLIDRKIENNNKINDNLQQQLRLIYNKWFIQCNTPFNDEQSDETVHWDNYLMRRIPNGWNIKELSAIGTIVCGGTPSTAHPEYYSEKGVAWITPNDLSSNTQNIFINHGARDISQQGLDNSSATLMPAGSVLLSTRAPIGYIAISETEVCTNQGFKSIVPDKGYDSAYIYFTLLDMIPRILHLGAGTTFMEVSKDSISSLRVLCPPQDIVEAFCNIAKPLMKQCSDCQNENTHLERLRGYLLPLLMSGQATIAD